MIFYTCNIFRDFPSQAVVDWDEEDDVVSDLVLIGIVGIQDPVRPEVSNQCLEPLDNVCLSL